ncbi:MAG: hypothetical protein NTX28_07595 [Novosphingobium sp.]|nr:hypothetical protein [Novosphingobium sp.]
MATIPPTINPAPAPAPQRGDRATFSSRVDAFVTWLTAAVAQFGAAAANVYANAVDAYNQAGAAAASAAGAATSATQAQQYAAGAAASAGASVWVSGTTYPQYAAVFDPTPGVLRAYRRTTAAGVSTTAPSADPTNWAMELPAMLPCLQVQDRKASGTSPGSVVSLTQTVRELQTIIGTNSIQGASLSANQISFPAGTYDFSGFVSAPPNASAQSNLYNVTDNSVIAISGTSGSSAGSLHFLSGRFTISATKLISARTWSNVSATAGVSASSGLNEVYASLTFTKVG